jgi:hypothetical protein
VSYALKQSQTTRPLLFLMTDSADHISAKTGLTPTVTLSKNGAAFGAPTGAVSEVGSGWYKVAGNATDTGTLGPLLLHATSAGADPTDVFFEVVSYDPEDAAALGLSRLDAAISSRASAAALATVQADTDDLQTRVPAALVGGRMDSSLGAYAAGQDPATLLLDVASGIEPSVTLRQALRVIFDAASGQTSGAPGSPFLLKSADGAKTRATVTTDANGNRLTVTFGDLT